MLSKYGGTNTKYAVFFRTRVKLNTATQANDRVTGESPAETGYEAQIAADQETNEAMLNGVSCGSKRDTELLEQGSDAAQVASKINFAGSAAPVPDAQPLDPALASQSKLFFERALALDGKVITHQ